MADAEQDELRHQQPVVEAHSVTPGIVFAMVVETRSIHGAGQMPMTMIVTGQDGGAGALSIVDLAQAGPAWVELAEERLREHPQRGRSP